MSAAQLNLLIGGLFFLCYAYQLVYLLVSLLPARKQRLPARQHRFAVLIAARNEQAVLGQLLKSLAAQRYPRERFTVCVVADNCTDATAAVALVHGARVFTRQDAHRVGKGYALDFLLHRLWETAGNDAYDAYLVLDADNLLEPDYLQQMDKTLSQGYDVVTGYRNSKNYGDNWISAGYALWFLRDSRQLNGARARLEIGCVVSGTGFAFTHVVAQRQGGWPFHTLTEDTEFTAAHLCAGDRIGYCPQAVLYDEQPVRISQSMRQRMRWAKGYFQVLRRYGRRLTAGALRGCFACYDLMAAILPAFLLSLVSLAVNGVDAVVCAAAGRPAWPALLALGQAVLGACGTLYLFGGVTLMTEWRRIRVPAAKKLGYFLLFPLFMLTYLPAAVAALFCRVGWKPVEHTRALSVEQLSSRQ